jgi:hypothetical protein
VHELLGQLAGGVAAAEPAGLAVTDAASADALADATAKIHDASDPQNWKNGKPPPPPPRRRDPDPEGGWAAAAEGKGTGQGKGKGKGKGKTVGKAAPQQPLLAEREREPEVEPEPEPGEHTAVFDLLLAATSLQVYRTGLEAAGGRHFFPPVTSFIDCKKTSTG